MEKEKLIESIISVSTKKNNPEVDAWVNESTENREEYIQYKNLWAIMQTGSEISELQIRNSLSEVRKNTPSEKSDNKPLEFNEICCDNSSSACGRISYRKS